MEDSGIVTSGSALRSLPHNLEAERSVLGAILVENEALHRAQELLREDDFYRDAHRRIYRAMAQLSEKSTNIDLITLKNELERDGSLGPCGGSGYIASLIDGVARSANIDHYARIVREKAMLRNLIHSSNRIITDAMAGDGEAVHILDAAERSIFQIAQDQLRPGFVPIREGAQEILRIIEDRAGGPQVVTGIPTGFSQLNELTSGLQPADLIIVAARPAMGKTTFCLNIAHFVGVRLQKAVGIFSLEMTQQQVILRLLCAEAQVDSHLLRTGRLGKPEWSKVAIALEELAAAPIFIDDSPGLTVLEMKAKARRLKAEKGLDLLIVDYLQLMQAGGSRENRTQEISEISRSLKGLAKELHIPLVAISQLSRAPEIRGGTHQPQLSDLRECVTGDTLVVLADGRRVPIDRLVGQAPQVLAVSKEGRIVSAQSDKVWRVGKRSVVHVRLASGRAITATGDHRLLTLEGWRRVSSLRAGARLACARLLPEPPETETWPDRRVAVMQETVYGGSSQFRLAPSRAVPTQSVALLDDPVLASKSGDDLFWDRIVGIEPGDEVEVFDLTVPEHGSWLADGIVSHNSGAIEQDADVVLFILREEVYRPTEENRGIAQLSIKKQRNGPTGDIRLAFLSRFTKFADLEWRTE